MILLFIMMVIVTVDTLLRYLNLNTIPGVYEFTEHYLMVGAVFLSMSYVMKLNGHVSLDILVRKFSKGWLKKINLFNCIFVISFLFLIALTGMEMAVDAFNSGKVGTGLVPWPFWISYSFIPLGAVVFFLRLLFNIIIIANDLFSKSNSYN